MSCVVEEEIKLNEEQQKAVEKIDGPLLVLAGAGSGKTRVVTQRIIHLINSGVYPSQILGLTFTNKAAGEMKERIEKLTSAKVLISTFHSLGARILRESIHYLGYPNRFTIYDADDAEKLIKGCLTELKLPDKKGDVNTIKSLISSAKNGLLTLKGQEQELYNLYQTRLRECDAVDFDDLLYLPVQLFTEHPEVLASYQRAWKYLLIDEYQDTNEAQYRLIQMLVEKSRNICVVGDPDQSIYSWRGANLHNILNFEKDYPDALVVRLEQNYRSTSTILEAANALIKRNVQRLDKKLWSAVGSGDKIRLIRVYNEREEAKTIVREIDQLRGRRVPLDEIVVFYRTNAQSRVFEDQLLFADIPYRIIGGLSFYQRREIKDILAYLKVVQSDSDFISLQRVINLPKRGVGDASLDKLRQESIRLHMPIFTTIEQVLSGQINLKLTPKLKEGLTEFVKLIHSLRTKKEALYDLVQATIKESGYINYLKEDMLSFEERFENVDQLLTKAHEWEQERDDATLTVFLEELSLRSSADEGGADEERLNLMTLHNSKGLEFDYVFMVGMEEMLFPHVNSQGDADSIEEERRLCYVGVTRARRRLYLSHARERSLFGSTRLMRPSRFLSEIPSHYTQLHHH